MPQLSTFFFFNDTATTEIYTLSLHDALPIWNSPLSFFTCNRSPARTSRAGFAGCPLDSILPSSQRSEEHTSELQSRLHLVCRLLLVKKNFRMNCKAPDGHRITCAAPTSGGCS